MIHTYSTKSLYNMKVNMKLKTLCWCFLELTFLICPFEVRISAELTQNSYLKLLQIAYCTFACS